MTITAAAGANSPALHHFTGLGLDLHFQDGPIGEAGVNGTTNEEVIQVLIDRIESLNAMQGGKYACEENTLAIWHLRNALSKLKARTAAREARGVEGTMAV